MALPEWSIRFRRGRALEWSSKNPVLRSGEPGYESDTGRMKVGDGETAWNQLQYFNEDETSVSLLDHINSPTPHSVYDDGPSLLLLYENKKV